MTTLHVAAGCHAGAPLSLDLDGGPLIRGPMGCGKSTIGHALALALYGVTMDARPWPYGDGEVAIEGEGYSYAIRASGGPPGRSMAVRGVMVPAAGKRIAQAQGPLAAPIDGAPDCPPGLLILSPSLWLQYLRTTDGQRRLARLLEAMLPGPSVADLIGAELAALTQREAAAMATRARQDETRADGAVSHARASLAAVGPALDVEPVDATAEQAAYEAELLAWQARDAAYGVAARASQASAQRRAAQQRARERVASVPCRGSTLIVDKLDGAGEFGDYEDVDCGACPLLRDAVALAAEVIPDDPPAPPVPGPRPEPPDVVARAAAYAVAQEREASRARLSALLAQREAELVTASARAREAERIAEEVRTAPARALAAKLQGLQLPAGLALHVDGEAVTLTRNGRDVLTCSTGEQVHAGVCLRHALRVAMGHPAAWLVVDSAQDMGPWPADLPHNCIVLRTEGSALEVSHG